MAFSYLWPASKGHRIFIFYKHFGCLTSASLRISWVEPASSEKQRAEKRSGDSGDEPAIESLKLEIENLQQREKEDEILLSCNNDIASIRDKKDLLQVIHNKLKRLFNVTDLFICKIDEKRE